MRQLQLLLTVCIALCFSGCGMMMGPLDEATFTSTDHEVHFFGYTTTPYERLIVVGTHPETGESEVFGFHWTNTWPSGKAYGIDWYRYNVNERIPRELWRPSADRVGMLEVEVQVLLTESTDLAREAFTFNDQFATYFDPLEVEYSLFELMKHAGNGHSVKLYAPDPRFEQDLPSSPF